MKFLIFFGFLFFIGSIFLLKDSIDIFNVGNKGQIVKMQIVKLPVSCIGSKVPYYVNFNYNGEIYNKQVRGNFCEKHHIGEMMDIKMLEGSSNILFPNQSGLFDLFSCCALGILGLTISIIGLKKVWV